MLLIINYHSPFLIHLFCYIFDSFNVTETMKKSLFSIFLIAFVLSCTQNGNKTSYDNQVKKDVLESAIKYAMSKYKVSKETVAQDGTIIVTDNQTNFVIAHSNPAKYIIDPSKITIGLINDDSDEDAIVNVISVSPANMETPENLIFIKTDGKFVLNSVTESNMRVLGIKDRIITAEVSSRSLNNPLRDCHECKEVVHYKFKTGELIKVE